MSVMPPEEATTITPLEDVKTPALGSRSDRSLPVLVRLGRHMRIGPVAGELAVGDSPACVVPVQPAKNNENARAGTPEATAPCLPDGARMRPFSPVTRIGLIGKPPQSDSAPRLGTLTRRCGDYVEARWRWNGVGTRLSECVPSLNDSRVGRG